jgi:hypothetical protein
MNFNRCPVGARASYFSTPPGSCSLSIPTPVSCCSSLELGFGAFGRDRPLGFIVLNFRLIGGCVTLPPLTKNGPAQ